MKELSIFLIKYIKDVVIIKKLPKIYQNSIDKCINNNKQIYYSNDKRKSNMNYLDIEVFVDGIFNSNNQSYNIPVLIETVNNSFDTYLIARRGDVLLTIDNDKVNIKDILSINRKNPN